MLNTLAKLIIKKNTSEIFKLLTENVAAEIKKEELFRFFDSFTIDKEINFNKIGISGSGKSGIKKPNIGSIVSIFISDLYRLDIVKVGSKGTMGKGSTDFFLKYKDLLGKSIKLRYYDVEDISPWKKYYDILCINKSISSILKNLVWHEYQYSYKIVGITEPEVFIRYLNIEHFRKPSNLMLHTSTIGNRNIDEIMGTTKYLVNGKIVEIQYLNNLTMDTLVKDTDIDAINESLLKGEILSDFWFNCLKNTFVSYVSFLTNREKVCEIEKDFLEYFNWRKRYC